MLGSGTFTVVVEDDSAGTGSFALTPRRLTSPTGCAPLPSVAIGGPAVTRTIAIAGDVHCLAIPDVNVGDRIEARFAVNGMAAVIVDGIGRALCSNTTSSASLPCELDGTAPWKLLVYDYGGNETLPYSVGVRRLTAPDGCMALDDPPSGRSRRRESSTASTGR